jgi:hypothetical protein
MGWATFWAIFHIKKTLGHPALKPMIAGLTFNFLNKKTFTSKHRQVPACHLSEAKKIAFFRPTELKSMSQ